MANCKFCGVELKGEKITPAFSKRGYCVCRDCLNAQARKLTAKKHKAKIEYKSLLKLNALGGLNIKILSHAKSGEPMYVVEQIGFDETKTNYYQAWGDFIGALKTIFKGMNK